MRNQPGELDDPSRAEVLKQRADALAASLVTNDNGSVSIPFLAFAVGEERYGIETRFIREVLEVERLTNIPGAHMFIAGVFSLRGEIVSVVDTAHLFTTPSEAPARHVIVLRSETMQFGLRASMVEGVRSVRHEDLQPAFATLSQTAVRYLKGVTPDSLALLDGAALLADPELIVNTE